MLKRNSVLFPCVTDVIHTVGPMARSHVGPTETNDLTSCYQNSLRLMKEHGLRTVVSHSMHYLQHYLAAQTANKTETASSVSMWPLDAFKKMF